MKKKNSTHKSDLLTALNNYFATTPREQVLKDWAEAEEATKDIKSPTMGEFLGWQGIVLAERKPISVELKEIPQVTAVNFISPSYVDEEMYLSC